DCLNRIGFARNTQTLQSIATPTELIARLLHSTALARCVMREWLRHLRYVPGPCRQECCAFVDLVGNHFVEGVGLAVVSFAIVRRLLYAEVPRHAFIDELNVVGRTEVARAQGFKIEDLLQRT